MENELQEEFRGQISKDLRKNAFREFANASFDTLKISEVETLRQNKTKELDGFRQELEGIDGNPENHKRESRDKAKELRAQIERAERFVKDCNITIGTIQQTAETQRQKAAQYLERATFVEKFTFEDHAK